MSSISAMNSSRRMLAILDLFTPASPVIDVELICEKLQYAQASAYRYVRELSDAGLLVRIPRGYTLGPRVIELDRQMSEHDPLLAQSRDVMASLCAQTGLHVLLSEFYGSTVVNVSQVLGQAHGALGFGRGQPMDLFRSATARVILACLLPRQLKRLYEMHASEPELQRLGQTWKDFSKTMLTIRKQGYCVSVSELDADKAGIAAPIFDEKRHVLGSITLVGSVGRMQAFNPSYLAQLVIGAATEISARIAVSG